MCNAFVVQSYFCNYQDIPILTVSVEVYVYSQSNFSFDPFKYYEF